MLDAKTLKTTKPRWSDDRRTFAYAEKGEVFVQRVDDAKPRSITPKPKKRIAAAPALRRAGDEEPESFSVGAFCRDGSKMVLTSSKGWYVASVADGARDASAHARRQERGEEPASLDCGRLDAGRRRAARAIQRARSLGPRRHAARSEDEAADAARQGPQSVSELPLFARRQHGRLSRSPTAIVPRISMSPTPASATSRKLTDLNPWIATKALPASELVSYRDADGKMLYGVLRYPVGYEKGPPVSDRVRDLRNILRQRLQRPRGVPRRTTATPCFTRR